MWNCIDAATSIAFQCSSECMLVSSPGQCGFEGEIELNIEAGVQRTLR
jgi:hypothetical protein